MPFDLELRPRPFSYLILACPLGRIVLKQATKRGRGPARVTGSRCMHNLQAIGIILVSYFLGLCLCPTSRISGHKPHSPWNPVAGSYHVCIPRHACNRSGIPNCIASADAACHCKDLKAISVTSRKEVAD